MSTLLTIVELLQFVFAHRIIRRKGFFCNQGRKQKQKIAEKGKIPLRIQFVFTFTTRLLCTVSQNERNHKRILAIALLQRVESFNKTPTNEKQKLFAQL